jgi:hypothetical protein
MIWVIGILCIVGFIILLNIIGSSKTNPTIPINYGLGSEDHQLKIDIPSTIEEIARIEPSTHFYDRELFFDDKSYLSPSEARREMNQRKEDGEWFEFEEYGGYMNAIYSGRDDDYVEKIENMTPEKVEKWYFNRIENGKWNTTSVFEAVAEKLKPFHEQHLISAMDNVTPGRIEGWVSARKKEGYFFSQLAYEKANKIFNGEIDNRRKRSRKN